MANAKVVVLDKHNESIQYLITKDKRLAKVISLVGNITYCPHEDPYPFLNQIALLRDAFPTFASLAKAVPLRGSLFCCMSMFHSCSQMHPVLFSNPAFSFTLVITT